MNNWKRIVLVVFVLIGGTMSFGYWSLNQFEHVFDDLTASTATVFFPIDRHPIVFETANIEISEMSNTETSMETSDPETLTSILSTSPINKNDLNPKFQLVFSPKQKNVYIGCTYEISWLTPTTIKSLEASLVDIGTRKPAGPIASGISKENIIDKDSQNLKWKVGVVWPGEYFILISKINDIVLETKSHKFVVNEMPSGVNKEEKENLCEETGGNLI